MAKIGLSKPYFAKYTAASGAVSYSDGGLIGKYTEMAIEVEGADANILYGDNAPAERDVAFAGGTFSMSTTELDGAVMKDILGVSTAALGTGSGTWYVFDDDQEVPYLGVGGVIKKRVNGADKYVAFVLDKVQFDNPSIEAVTQGESIEWGVQALSAQILRADNAKHSWRRISSNLASEAEAEAAVKSFLGIS